MSDEQIKACPNCGCPFIEVYLLKEYYTHYLLEDREWCGYTTYCGDSYLTAALCERCGTDLCNLVPAARLENEPTVHRLKVALETILDGFWHYIEQAVEDDAECKVITNEALQEAHDALRALE